MMEEEVPSASPRGAASRRTTTTGASYSRVVPQEDDNSNGNYNDHDRTPRRSMIGLYLSPSYLMSRVLFMVSFSMKIVALLLYPVRFVSTILFPPGEFDNISSKDSSSRAAAAFVSMMDQTYIQPPLRRNTNNSGDNNFDNDFMCPFVDQGYSELVQEIAVKAHNHNHQSMDAAANANGNNNDDNNVVAPPLLLLYLHSPLHGQVPSFVSNTLCNANFLSMLNQHVHNGTLACWGGSIHTADGAHVQNSLQVNSYPFLALVKVKGQGGGQQPNTTTTTTTNNNNSGRSNSGGSNNNESSTPSSSSTSASGTTTTTTTNATNTNTNIQKQHNLELHFRMEGPSLQSISPSNLHLHLSNSLNAYQQQLSEQTLRRLQRQEEIHLRQEQDREYQEALEEDRRREREKQEEADRMEAEERRVKEEVEQIENRKREKLQKARDLLGKDYDEQPDSSSSSSSTECSPSRSPSRSIARIRLMLPSGKRVERKFWGDDSVNVVRAFLILHFDENDIEMDNFQLSSNYPKKALVNGDATLEEEGLCPQSVIMVQDLDA